MKNTQSTDKSNLRQVILDSPDQFETGFKIADSVKIRGSFKSICVSGMGGSSWPIDLLKTYLNHLQKKDKTKNKIFNIYQNRTYSLPLEAYDNCLNIFTSFSGNTEETLSCLDEAIKHRLPSCGITHGGKLQNICSRNNISLVNLPFAIQPRYATGYFFSAIFKILADIQLTEDISSEINKLIPKLKEETKKLEKKGKFIAKKLAGKTPIIYSSSTFQSIPLVWKIKINENSKTPAFWNCYPELSHNEMVGFTLPQAKYHILALWSPDDHPQIIKRFKITGKLLKKKGIETTFIEMPGDNIFNTIFATSILGDWISYYLALEYKQDPTPVDMVEDLKKMLA